MRASGPQGLTAPHRPALCSAPGLRTPLSFPGSPSLLSEWGASGGGVATVPGIPLPRAGVSLPFVGL